MTAQLKTIVITGANKGIGFGVADNLAEKIGWQIVLACRDLKRAEDSRRRLVDKHRDARVMVEQLDVSNEGKICDFVNKMKGINSGIDVLINNAGIYIKEENNEKVVKETLATNLFGTISLTEKIIGAINKRGKIITLGSSLGKYKVLQDENLQNQFKSPTMNKQELFDVMERFQKSMRDDKLKSRYPSAYIMSKMAINVYMTRILPLRQDIIDKEIQVYGQCPGYVSTDMTENKGFLPVEKGALTTVFLAELPFQVDSRLQGQFFQRCKVSSL